MLKVSLRNLVAHKMRLVLTFLAVSLGVAFMSGTLVLSDTIGRTFDDLFADVNRGTDAFVRGVERYEGTFDDVRPWIDADLRKRVEQVDGVAAAEVLVQGYGQIIDPEGDPIGNPSFGPPTFAGNWIRNDELNPFNLVDGGRAPTEPDELVIDKRSADDAGYELGDTVRVQMPKGTFSYTLVGIARFGTADSPGGATFAMMTERAAQRRVTQPGKVNAIGVVADDGVSQEEVARAVRAAVGNRVEVLTGEEITKENQDDIREGFSFLTTFLLVFAFIALVVGSFVIFNSFTILVAQRTREMALLRAIGASRRQVLTAVLVEALIVGLLASTAGFLLGLAVATGLESLLDSIGGDIPASGLLVKPGAIISAVVTGVVVTLLAALVPALRASRVAPLAAMRDVAVESRRRSVVRIVIASVVMALGLLSLFSGLSGEGGVEAVGTGVFLVFTSAVLFGPVFARPTALAIGAPLPAARGITGKLARENAARNPRRTSSTASAVLIGVGIIAFFLTFNSSIRASIDAIVDERFNGDFAVAAPSGFGPGGLPPELAERVEKVPQVERAVGIGGVGVLVDGTSTFATAIDTNDGFVLFDLALVAGSAEAANENGTIAVYSGRADDKGWKLGDKIPVVFAQTGERQLRIAAIYDNKDLAGDYTVGAGTIAANVPDHTDFQVAISLVDGADPVQARAALEKIVDDYPTGELLDLEEYKNNQTEQFTPILALVFVLLLLTIIIAVLGIVNTLALSVFERTRELGLLRAVGATRAQIRSMVRWESVIIALLGTGIGLTIGLFFGWAMVQALEEEGFSEFRVPVFAMGITIVLAALFGLLAALYPAWRAGRLDVLEAIFDE